MPKNNQYFLLIQQFSARNGKYFYHKMHEMKKHNLS